MKALCAASRSAIRSRRPRKHGHVTHDFVTGRGPVSAGQLKTYLLPVLAPDILLISDGAKAYDAFAQEAHITHEAVNVRAGIRARGALHLQKRERLA